MNLPGMSLVVNATDNNKEGLLQGFFSQVPQTAGTTFRQDTVPVTLRAVDPSANPSRYWDDIDIRTASIQLAIDDPDLPPTQGTFSLTFGANATGPLAFNISAADMATALNALASIVAAGGVTVVLDGLDYVVSFITNGVRALITETDISLYPASLITVIEDQAGSADVPAIQVVSVFQAPAAYLTDFAPLPDAGYSVLSTQTGTGSVPSSQQITFDPAPFDGSFILTTALGTTSAVPFNVTQTALASALNAITGAAGRYSVSGVGGGPYTITDSTGDNTPITASIDGLIVPVGVTGMLVLNTPAMRARFLGVTGNSITLLLEILVGFSGNPPSTLFQGNVTVNKNVIRGAAGGFSPANPLAILQFVNNEFSITGFTGGAPLNLDGIGTTNRVNGELHAAVVGGALYLWKLIAGAWPGGVSPFVIQPTDYNAGTNEKYWSLVSLYLDTDNTLAANSDTRAASQKAIKAFVLAAVAAGAGPWIVKTAAYTAVAGDRIQADTLTTAAFTITLPATATVGDSIQIEDANFNWNNANLTIGRNGLKINGGTSDFVASISGNKLSGVYISTAYGWSIK